MTYGIRTIWGPVSATLAMPAATKVAQSQGRERTKAKASPTSLRIDFRDAGATRPASTGSSAGITIKDSATAAMTKLAASAKKAGPVPQAAIITPPKAGPSMLVVIGSANCCTALAWGRSLAGTRLGITALEAGRKKAWLVP